MIPAEAYIGPSRASKGRRRLAVRAILIALSTLFALLCVEVALRLAAQRANAGTLQAALTEVQPASAESDARLGNLIRLSENDRIRYELQPGLTERTFRGIRVSTDEHCFRVSPPVPDDERPLVTIVGVGDSIMFGHGVEDDETYLYHLQLLLQELRPERRWRVINGGVPGYNTVMEVETLRTKCLQFEPDLVILNIVGNDYEPPYFVREEEDVWALDRSFLVERLREDDAHALLAPGSALYESDSDGARTIPERHRRLFGRQAFLGALDDLQTLSEQHGFDVLVFTTYEWDVTFEMVASAADRGFPHSTLMPELRAWMMREHGVDFEPIPYSKTELVVGQHNSHPSRMQHEMAGKRLVADLLRLGLLDALVRGD